MGKEPDKEDRRNDDPQDRGQQVKDTTGDKECPECGAPVDDVRATCPGCGYEYQADDYTDPEAGKEFIAGSAIDDEGREIPDHESGS